MEHHCNCEEMTFFVNVDLLLGKISFKKIMTPFFNHHHAFVSEKRYIYVRALLWKIYVHLVQKYERTCPYSFHFES